MAGYTAHRVLRHEFPELGPDVWVELKNPYLLPANRLNPAREPRRLPNGTVDMADVAKIGYDLYSWLVVDWNVYPAWDGESEMDTEPLGPPSPETLARVPTPVEVWITEQVSAAGRPS